MANAFIPFSDEQLRVAANLEQHYDVWIQTQRSLFTLPYGMQWKTVSERDYLYLIHDRRGNGTSLGPRSSETEARYAAYREEKDALGERAKASAARLEETCRLYRTLRLPMVASEAAKILREADRRSLLGSHLIVVGTNAMPAYALEAGGRLDGVPDETDDFDMAWTYDRPETALPDRTASVWTMLKAVDATYTVNSERPFQARNAAAYEFELLSAESRIGTMHRQDKPKPVPLPEQEWLLPGIRVTHVVVGRDGSPARIVAPDPRWFALQKLWMAAQDKRDPLKRKKDAAQGKALLDTISAHMRRFVLDKAFEHGLPAELLPFYREWERTRDAADGDAAPPWSSS
jgi:hypothetical protein